MYVYWPLCILSYGVTLLSNTPYLCYAASFTENVELLSCSGVWLGLFVSLVLLCFCACCQTGCQVHNCKSRGRQTCHSYLPAVVSEPPHPHLHSHSSCPSNSSQDGCFSLRDPHSHIFLHIRLFYMKLCTSRKKGVMPLLPPWLLLLQNKTELYVSFFSFFLM